MAAKRCPSSVAVLRRVDKERKTISSCSPPRPLALNIFAASLQCYPMTSFLSEKIFYHGWTRIHTDGKEGSTMLDTNRANYRQLNSVNSRNSHLALIRPALRDPCPSVVKEKALRLSASSASLR